MSSFFRQQRTISRAVRVAGFGYWTGQDVSVEFRPAPAHHGLVFVRDDLSPPRSIPALVQNRMEVPRRTSLAAGRATVEMVEHVMAALGGMRVDNCEIRVDGAEMPGCDGSSQPFVTALETAGFVEQDAVHDALVIDEVLRVGDDDCWVEARPAVSSPFSIHCEIDYGAGSSIGRQAIALDITPASFLLQLAAARTFLLEQEAVWLRSQGLGGRVTCQDLLVFDEAGPIGNALRFADECARHKALDMVGDLTLAGCDLIGHFVAHCSGHRLNAELVAALLARAERNVPCRKSA